MTDKDKKIEFNGKLYEPGKYYLTLRGELVELHSVTEVYSLKFQVLGLGDNRYSYEDELIAVNVAGPDAHLFGTIEDAPFVAEAGKAYQFSDDGIRWFIRTFEFKYEMGYKVKCGWVYKHCRPVPKEERLEYGD
jgi:hypothetical protein